MRLVQIKPMSVNAVWQGRRYKTAGYKSYERLVMSLLPPVMEIPDGQMKLVIEFGYSNKLADFDNGVKPFVDILQKKYKFNDSRIKQAQITVNNAVLKGEEYIQFDLLPVE